MCKLDVHKRALVAIVTFLNNGENAVQKINRHGNVVANGKLEIPVFGYPYILRFDRSFN